GRGSGRRWTSLDDLPIPTDQRGAVAASPLNFATMVAAPGWVETSVAASCQCSSQYRRAVSSALSAKVCPLRWTTDGGRYRAASGPSRASAGASCPEMSDGLRTVRCQKADECRGSQRVGPTGKPRGEVVGDPGTAVSPTAFCYEVSDSPGVESGGVWLSSLFRRGPTPDVVGSSCCVVHERPGQQEVRYQDGTRRTELAKTSESGADLVAREIDHDAEPRPDGWSVGTKASFAEHGAKVDSRGEVHSHEVEARRVAESHRGQPRTFVRLRPGVIDLEDLQSRRKFRTPP